MDDVSLEALRRKDARAIAAFRAMALPRLTAACERLLGARALAEEVAEEVCLDFLMDYVEQVQRVSAVPAYLQVMAVRRCTRLRRQRALHAELASDGLEAAGDDSAIRHSELRLDGRRLERCLSVLTPSSRRILRLRFFGEHTQEEIGNVMGVSKQYVGRVIQKSLETLRRCLESRGGST